MIFGLQNIVTIRDTVHIALPRKMHFTEHRAASDRAAELSSITRCRKITVGTSNGMFFLVKAEGDSWEEIIDKLTTEKQSA